ncbi:MAG: hypothetical protein ACLFTA_01185 [Candidatus Nanohaloarchaea archaeon]
MFRPGLTIAVRAPLAVISILIYLFIRTPLHYLGASSSWIWNSLENAVDNIITEKEKTTTDKYGRGKTEPVKRPKNRYVALFLFFTFLGFYAFGFDTSTLTSMLTDATLLAIPLTLLPLIATLIASSLSVKLSGRSLTSASEPEPRSINYTETAKAGYKAGKQAHGLYKDLKPKENREAIKKGAKANVNQAKRLAARGGRMADAQVENRGLASIANQLKKIPLAKRLAPMLLDSGGLAGGTAIAFLLVVLIVLIVIWLFVAGLLILLFGGLLRGVFLPFLGETFGPAIGLGSDYAGYGGAELGGSLPSYDFTGESNALKMAWARVGCALEGPECLREMQMNNSERPGSESVGLKFGLEIEDFSINHGNTFDISGREKDDTLPFSFDVYNPVKNFRGIDAHDVQYRLKVGGSGSECIANGSDSSWGQKLGEGTIRRGGFERPTAELEDLTLKNCGLLQPALGIDKDADLQIRYDYSSQSTLQFQAMSEEYMLEEEMRPEPTASDTANTPVQAYVNVQNPVTFENTGDGREPEIIPVYVGFETEQFDIDYKVKSEEIKLVPSSAMIDVDTANEKYDMDLDGSCKDLNYDETNEVYTVNPDSSSVSNIEAQQEDGWFSKGFGPSTFECDMILDPGRDTGPIDSISPTGETLTMRVDANYTVRLASQTKSFEAVNNRCGSGRYNCPLIVTNSEAQDSALKSSCDSSWRIDAAGGCTVVDNSGEEVNTDVINEDNNYRNDIDNREEAFILSNLVNRINDSKPDIKSDKSEAYNGNAAVGVSKRNIDLLDSQDPVRIVNTGSSGNKDIEVREMDYKLCKEDSDRVDDFVKRSSRDEPVYTQYKVDDCKDLFGTDIFVNSCSDDEDAIRVNRDGNIRCLTE